MARPKQQNILPVEGMTVAVNDSNPAAEEHGKDADCPPVSNASLGRVPEDGVPAQPRPTRVARAATCVETTKTDPVGPGSLTRRASEEAAMSRLSGMRGHLHLDEDPVTIDEERLERLRRERVAALADLKKSVMFERTEDMIAVLEEQKRRDA